jgi:hypothetical protein
MPEEKDIVFEDVFSKLETVKPVPMEHEEREKEYNSLYEELQDKCNPDNFLPPNEYDRKKAIIANEICLQLKGVRGDIEKQKQLRHQAIIELDIRFNSHKLRDKLKEYANPQKYRLTEKFELATELYDNVLKNGNNVEALENVQLLIESELLHKTIVEIEEQEKQKKQKKQEEQRIWHEEQEKQRIRQEEQERIPQKQGRKAGIAMLIIIVVIFVVMFVLSAILGNIK